MVRLRSLKDKRVLITGGSSGIGMATAQALSNKGAKIIIAARNGEKLESARKNISGIISTISADISRLSDIEILTERIEKEQGNIDILINCAGIVHPGKLKDLSNEQITRQIDINLTGTIMITKTLLHLMNSPGYIVNISSAAGFVGIFGYTAYSASKFGVVGFSEALRMELEPEGIGVSVVFPPDTETPQLEFENRTKPKELKSISGKIKPITPKSVADSIVKGILSGDFLIFPDGGSRSAYMASRMAGPVVRSWMDKQIRRSSERNG